MRWLVDVATQETAHAIEANAHPIYDRIGADYAHRRRPDPRIVAAVREALGGATRVLNVGAGTGSYEVPGITVAAVEPSVVMATQRPSHLVPAVLASAEALPFADGSFDAASAILTVHHWADPGQGLRELARVTAGPIVILTFDPEVSAGWWLPAEYAPELRPLFAQDTVAIATYEQALGDLEIQVVPVPAECEDGFLMAFWDRPELVLDAQARGYVGFARLTPEVETEICKRLSADLTSGAWDRRLGYLRDLAEFDSGLRLLVARGGSR